MTRYSKRAGAVRAGLTAVLALVLMLASMPHAALAQDVAPAAPEGRINDNLLEFGVWWVEDYPPAGPGGADLPATRPDALGLRDMLTSTCKVSFLGFCFTHWNQQPPWTPRFVYGNSNAWASDWRGAGGSAAGHENFYIDTVDLAYFAGHGSKNGLSFGAGSPSPTFVHKNDLVGHWGDRDMDWAALAACNILDNPVSNLQDWGNTMNGVRLILGFQTVMNDVPHGREFGRYIRDGYSLTQAWFKAADKLQSQGRVARVLAEQQAYFNDKPAQHNAATTVNWPKYYQTHAVGSEPARHVDIDQLAARMPVLQVQPLSLAEVEQRIDDLENAFDTKIVIPKDENGDGSRVAGIQAVLQNGGIFYSEDGQLEFDGNYGLFLHADMNNLWAVDNDNDQLAAAGVPMVALSEEDARQIADDFLSKFGFMPGDAEFFEVAHDTLSTMDEVVTAAGTTEIAVTAERTLNYQVIYSRIYSPNITVADLYNEPVQFSVMGPGSKLKVYVPTQVAVSAAQNGVQPIGAMGGYRNILEPAISAETGAVRTVEMLPVAVIEKLFNSELEASVALDHIPLSPNEIVSREIISLTAAYWEGPMGFNQGELIPVYALEVRNTLRNPDESTYEVPSTTYIPVNPKHMAPLARISTTTDLSGNVSPGQVIVFEALDASKTLVELGLDDDPSENPLDFNLGTPDGLFIYAWYLNEYNPEDPLQNRLAVGQFFEYTVALGGNVDAKDATSGAQRIILVVTDSLKDSEPNTSQAVATLNAVPPVHLPSVLASD